MANPNDLIPKFKSEHCPPPIESSLEGGPCVALTPEERAALEASRRMAEETQILPAVRTEK